MEQFIYRVEGFDLVPGNKTAGFTLIVSTKALQVLQKVTVTTEQYQDLMMQMRERVVRSKLFPKNMVSGCGVQLFKGSACPAYFTTDPVLGGSVGADPDHLLRLQETDALEQFGETMSFTPHNTDSPAQAMALLIMIQTWDEWARALAPLEADRS